MISSFPSMRISREVHKLSFTVCNMKQSLTRKKYRALFAKNQVFKLLILSVGMKTNERKYDLFRE